MNSNFSGRMLVKPVMLLCIMLLTGLFCFSDHANAEEPVKARIAADKAKIPFPKPPSHSANWLEYHGRTVEPGASAVNALANSCITCHEKTDCISCHNVRAPRDHTNTWRTVSHGFIAEVNRDRCLTCHKQDFCVRCHNETAPRSHTGGWSTGFTPRHCRQCHFASASAPEEGCAICHRKALHTSAPHRINQQVNCALCHN